MASIPSRSGSLLAAGGYSGVSERSVREFPDGGRRRPRSGRRLGVCPGVHLTPAVREWLAKHPRFHMHFTPTSSSWLNQVERWFGLLTEKLLRRGVHKSVRQLGKDILAWTDAWNEDPRPFIWTKSAEEILESLGRLLQRIKDQDTSCPGSLLSGPRTRRRSERRLHAVGPASPGDRADPPQERLRPAYTGSRQPCPQARS